MHIRRALKEQKKLLSAGDDPDAPAYVRDQTPLRTKDYVTTLDLRNEYRKAPKLSILLDDDPLIRCIRDGIDHDVFIYREGDLVWGKGDPTPSIKISENAFVHTVAKAKELGLWPRKVEEPEEEAGRDEPVKKSEPIDEEGEGGRTTGETEREERLPPDLQAEGPLQQALTELFEKARSGGVKGVTELRIKLFEARDAWNVHQAVATYRDAEVRVEFAASLSGDEIDSFTVGFRGSLGRANSVKSFLDPQLRTATHNEFVGEYRLDFKQPLSMLADRTQAFTKAMTKYGGGEAYVEARAAAQEV